LVKLELKTSPITGVVQKGEPQYTTLSGLQSMLEMGWDASVTFCSSDREPITPSSLPASSCFTLLWGYVLCGHTCRKKKQLVKYIITMATKVQALFPYPGLLIQTTCEIPGSYECHKRGAKELLTSFLVRPTCC